MAMYLQQKDVEATVVSWIQAACMYMIDEAYVQTAVTLKDRGTVEAVLKGQQNEWSMVCLPRGSLSAVLSRVAPNVTFVYEYAYYTCTVLIA
jgi:hypothetical protein